MRISFRTFALGLILAVVLVYLILLAQFKSFIDPLLILLPVPVGSYEVKGRATNHGAVVVPVLIEEGRTTVVDLEGAMPPQVPPRGGDPFVRLPDGQIVGTRAE